ncbi:unnamed protein product [Didymodactylos carnosus]|uniref:Uncharacterized protein n=1 Tax=Didymodactylos carnosus TaxID=1234261 RepID=A0A814KZL9_9BILA|nr:unnamed protein product [Didymodactylos carnosus]CAF3826297.1 unnamed protein product [Didymodactylos carnosus]
MTAEKQEQSYINDLSPAIIDNKTSLIFNNSHYSKIIKYIHLILLLDFLLHYSIAVELGALELIKRLFISHPSIPLNNSTIELCHLPIRQYIPFTLNEMSPYILFLSIITLFIAFGSFRIKSILLYQIYLILKFLFFIFSVYLLAIYTLVSLQSDFILSSITMILPTSSITEDERNFINIDRCLTHAKTKLSAYIFSVLNSIILFIGIEFHDLFKII